MPLRNTVPHPFPLSRLALCVLAAGMLGGCEFKPPASEAPPAAVLSPEQEAVTKNYLMLNGSHKAALKQVAPGTLNEAEIQRRAADQL